jgi:flagellar export protein FliJ
MRDRLQKIERLTRLVDIRQLRVEECERQVRQAEVRLARSEERLGKEKGNFDRLQAFFSYPEARTGLDLRQTEAALRASLARQERMAQDVENARSSVGAARQRWMDSRRERKVVETLRERRLHHAEREMDYRIQKATDEAAINRHRRGEFNT